MIRPDVPIMNSRVSEDTRGEYLRQIREANADRVWIALERRTLFEDRADDLRRLSENLRFFEENGLSVGVWMQAFGFGDPLPYAECGWTRLRSVTGISKEIDAICPEDPAFIEAYTAWVRDVAKLSPRLIMLDDDLCLSVRPGIGCFCDRHLKLLRDEVGDLGDLTKMFTGGKNRYRDAWYKVMGDTVRGFCRKVRETVDRVDPTIRVGVCAGYTSWDVEGTDPIEMSRILAGATEPFFRLTSAPYWVAPKTDRFRGQRLSAVIENARNQIAWCQDSGIEFFAEADSYPRPAYNCPAMLIENFDIAMHASGTKSLKYLFDYNSSPYYEKQYLKIHTRNLPLYDRIEAAFAGKKPCGVRVFRPMHRITDAVLPNEFIGEKAVMRSYFSSASAMLSAHAIPVSYGDTGDVAMVFGDDALYFDFAPKKTVLDVTAALLLMEKGIDVGIEGASDAPLPRFEIFGDERIPVDRISDGARFRSLSLKSEATVLSRFDTGDVASFVYGDFLVLAFDAMSISEMSSLYCSYERGKQLLGFYGNPFPSISGYADLYSISAEGDGKQVSLFQNLSIDPVFDFDIVLPMACRSFRLHGAEGALHGDRIRITSELSPQATMLLEVEYR